MPIPSVEKNPVFKKYVQKRRGILAATFAAAACAGGIMMGLAKDDSNKVAIAGTAMGFAAFITFQKSQQKDFSKALFHKHINAEVFPPSHPYSVFMDEVLKDSPKKAGRIYRSDSKEILVAGPLSFINDVYFSKKFDAEIGTEEMKIILGHEAGHVLDRFPVSEVYIFFNILARVTLVGVPLMAVTAPVSLPIALASVAASTAAFVFNKRALPYLLRQGEHLADIHAMYNAGSKTMAQQIIPKASDIIRKNIADYQQEEFAKAMEECRAVEERIIFLEESVTQDPYATHPLTAERVRVMDEAAKYMP
ncbi:MAG: hypothetical protein JWO78_896 [Micavibrio sp.]|nr:hypothetical protein [Micavibrio sp.]